MTNSFLEKLKKGMGVEELEEKNPNKTEEVLTIKEEVMAKKIIETKSKSKKASAKPKTKKEEEVQIKEKLEPAIVLAKEEKEKWPQPEGQLAIDVYQNNSELVIQSAIAGVKPENIDVSIDDDVITIKGERKKLSDEQGDYFYQECYWGVFSRQVISHVEIDPGRVDACLKDGVLTIKIPKIIRSKKRKIVIKG
jgi:HSP20 family protein